MPNNGKALTNASFRAKMLAVIDKLKNQDKTALVRHVDDFEQLNKDTFEAGMNALVEAIPEGGGGGGGDSGYVVTFTLDPTVSSQEEFLSCDKTIEDIIAHADEHIVGRVIIKNFPVDEDGTIFCDVYCDNMKFDYQIMKSDNPEIAPTLIQYTYLGFMSDGAIFSVTGDDGPIDNKGRIDNQGEKISAYYKHHIIIAYLFDNSSPHWEIMFETNGNSVITLNNIKMPLDYTYFFTDLYRLIISESAGTATIIGSDGSEAVQKIFSSFYPNANTDEYGAQRSSLYSPRASTNTGNVQLYNKAAQMEILVDFDGLSSDFRGIFTIGKFDIYHDPSWGYLGTMELYMDEDDSANNRIIKHIVKLEATHPSTGVTTYTTTYKRVAIPYTTI